MDPRNTSQEKIEELHALVYGDVQGVGFRATARAHARTLGLVGTVRNLPDGSVEIYAQGSREKLDLLLKQLHGSFAWGAISDIKTLYFPPRKTYSSFQIVP